VKVLIIDDEISLLRLMKLGLTENNHEVATAETAEGGITHFKSDIFDAVLCDIGLPDKDGLEVLSELRTINSEVPIVMITAHGSIESALTAMKRGAYDYIQKPFETEEIQIILERAFREKKLSEDYSRLKQVVKSEYDFSKIIGNSGSLRAVFDKIRKAADTKSTILITGESGTGKELISKAIHFNSPRKDHPFVVIDCGAIPANLLESELFGHIKGAFTGADRSKKGLCEEASSGTLFLDEIGELPIELQSKLLRLLQESTIRRVGEAKPISVDVRVIAATNRNLEEEIKANRFREDLFYRLNVVPIRSPSLRERKDDIAMLSHHFMKKFSRDYQRAAHTIESKVMERLIAYDWPGNVRQLQNLIEQMVVMSSGGELTLDLLPPPFQNISASTPPTLADNEWDLKKASERIQAYTEECLIRKAMVHTKNNKTKAAELLGISRRALIYKVQEYKIQAPTATGEAPESESDE